MMKTSSENIASALQIKNVNKSAKTKQYIFIAIRYVLMCLVGIFLIFPYVLMISRSFMTVQDINANLFFPTHPTFDNYIKIFNENNYMLYTFNTLKILLFNLIAVPFASSFCAYGFAKCNFPGKNFCFSAMLATMMIPGAVTQVPLYVLFSQLGWTESALPLTIPALFGGGALNIFLLRQFMRNIPNEMENAAKIDGANMFTRYFVITLPLLKPTLIYIIVGVIGSCWSDFYGPLVYITEREKYTLAVAIYKDAILEGGKLQTANLKMAAGAFMSIIPAFLFLFYQHKLVDGIMVGGIKG